ncbi:MAG: hypothetical protein IIA45_12765, partial [Bacteroidetes bacterium]|nr:hypothetical protein [Bacteroidota bacterium]
MEFLKQNITFLSFTLPIIISYLLIIYVLFRKRLIKKLPLVLGIHIFLIVVIIAQAIAYAYFDFSIRGRFDLATLVAFFITGNLILGMSFLRRKRILLKIYAVLVFLISVLFQPLVWLLETPETRTYKLSGEFELRITQGKIMTAGEIYDIAETKYFLFEKNYSLGRDRYNTKDIELDSIVSRTLYLSFIIDSISPPDTARGSYDLDDHKFIEIYNPWDHIGGSI